MIKLIELDDVNKDKELVIFDTGIMCCGFKVFIEASGMNDTDKEVRRTFINSVNDSMNWIYS